MRQTTATATAIPSQAHPYDAAYELDLGFQWDPATYGGGREALRTYLEKEHPHLLRAYDADFLVNAIESARAGSTR